MSELYRSYETAPNFSDSAATQTYLCAFILRIGMLRLATFIPSVSFSWGVSLCISVSRRQVLTLCGIFIVAAKIHELVEHTLKRKDLGKDQVAVWYTLWNSTNNALCVAFNTVSYTWEGGGGSIFKWDHLLFVSSVAVIVICVHLLVVKNHIWSFRPELHYPPLLVWTHSSCFLVLGWQMAIVGNFHGNQTLSKLLQIRLCHLFTFVHTLKTCFLQLWIIGHMATWQFICLTNEKLFCQRAVSPSHTL